jgi:general secretion pathway protein N
VRPGNPLWAIPFKDLSVTRERPIFSPSRRPPMSPVAAPPYVPPPPRPAEPQRPQLALVGTVVNANEGFGIFFDQVANAVVRLKTGEAHDGWVLHSVQGREATLQKDGETAVLALPARDAEQTGGVPPAAAPPPSVSSAAPVPSAGQPLRRVSPRVHHGPDD